MPTQAVSSPEIASPGGPYSPATLAAGTRLLSISGQVAQDPHGELIGGDDAAEQARQCFRNIDALLVAAGAKRTDIGKVTVYLTDMADRPAVARAREEYFGEHRPAATLVEVSALAAPAFKVEIEATALFS